MQIEELDFSVRTYNCLKRAKVDTVDQLSRMSDEDLMRLRCFGQKCLDEVRAKIPLHRKTNADWIRAMSDEELAKWFMKLMMQHVACFGEGAFRYSPCRNEEHDCVKCGEVWLQQPAEEVPDNE